MQTEIQSLTEHLNNMTLIPVSNRSGSFAVSQEYYYRESGDPLSIMESEMYEDLPENFDGEVSTKFRVIFISGEPQDPAEIKHFMGFENHTKADSLALSLINKRREGKLILSPQFWSL